MEYSLTLPPREPLLVVVLGPTASGKTALALAIARRFRGEIVNCDSVAMVREFEIGTAKPSPRSAPKFRTICSILSIPRPTSPPENTRARLGRLCTKSPHEVACRSSAAALDSICALCWKVSLPARSVRKIYAIRFAGAWKKAVQNVSIAFLRRLDPAAAARIHANDVPKVIRALEVCLAVAGR